MNREAILEDMEKYIKNKKKKSLVEDKIIELELQRDLIDSQLVAYTKQLEKLNREMSE